MFILPDVLACWNQLVSRQRNSCASGRLLASRLHADNIFAIRNLVQQCGHHVLWVEFCIATTQTCFDVLWSRHHQNIFATTNQKPL